MSPFSFRHKYKNGWLKMGDYKIWESAQQTLLGMEIGRSLHVDDVISLYKKAGRKLAVLSSSFSKII